MKMIVAHMVLFLVVGATFFSAVRAIQSGTIGVGPESAPASALGSSPSNERCDNEAATVEEGTVRLVYTLGPGGHPPDGYTFSHERHYWPVYVFTRSEEVRRLAAEQGLLGMTLEPGPLYAESELGFLAWVPAPLIPALEQHPEVERLEWDARKMPLAFWI